MEEDEKWIVEVVEQVQMEEEAPTSMLRHVKEQTRSPRPSCCRWRKIAVESPDCERWRSEAQVISKQANEATGEQLTEACPPSLIALRASAFSLSCRRRSICSSVSAGVSFFLTATTSLLTWDPLPEAAPLLALSLGALLFFASGSSSDDESSRVALRFPADLVDVLGGSPVALAALVLVARGFGAGGASGEGSRSALRLPLSLYLWVRDWRSKLLWANERQREGLGESVGEADLIQSRMKVTTVERHTFS